jgi:hypothetical protein
LLRIEDFDRFLFIAGAPRCGTTTLFHFLKANAAVASPVVKEPHLFSQNDLRAVPDADLAARVERDYLRRFFREDADRRVGMDASVTYLYAPEQLEPVLKLWPDARFVVSFRDPMTMLPSLHRRLVYIGDETIERFEDAWAAIVGVDLDAKAGEHTVNVLMTMEDGRVDTRDLVVTVVAKKYPTTELKVADKYVELSKADLARAVSEPLSKVEKIVMVGNGDGVQASKITGQVTSVLAQLPTLVESLTGVDLKKVVETKLLDGHKLDGKGE